MHESEIIPGEGVPMASLGQTRTEVRETVLHDGRAGERQDLRNLDYYPDIGLLIRFNLLGRVGMIELAENSSIQWTLWNAPVLGGNIDSLQGIICDRGFRIVQERLNVASFKCAELGLQFYIPDPEGLRAVEAVSISSSKLSLGC
jgi:hypothetical protein